MACNTWLLDVIPGKNIRAACILETIMLKYRARRKRFDLEDAAFIYKLEG